MLFVPLREKLLGKFPNLRMGGWCKEGREVWIQQEQQGWSCIPALWPRWRIPWGFLANKIHLAPVFWDKSWCDPLGVSGQGVAVPVAGARFVTPCVFSPPSPLLPAPLQVPSSPRYLRIRQPNLEVINLEWDHPEHPNGIITGYTLQYQPCTSHVFFPRINQEISSLPAFFLSMRNWRLPWWDKVVLGGVLAISRGGGGCSAVPQTQFLKGNWFYLRFRKIFCAA